MKKPIAIPKWEVMCPTECNEYSLFAQALENDPLVLFHATPKQFFDNITTSGFRSAKSLGTGALESVSYARKSSGCLAHIGNP